MMWSSMCSPMGFGCQVTVGLAVLIASLIFTLPFPAVVGSLVFFTTALVLFPILPSWKSPGIPCLY